MVTTTTDPLVEAVVDRCRRERVIAAAERGRNPREHADAGSMSDDEHADLIQVAKRAPVRSHDPSAVAREREILRREFELAADRGAPIPSGTFPSRTLALCFNDDEIRGLLERQRVGAEQARERRRSSDLRDEIRREVLHVAREREDAQAAADRQEAERRVAERHGEGTRKAKA